MRAESILQVLKPLPQPREEIWMEGTAPPPPATGDKSDANIRDIPHILQLAASLPKPPHRGQKGPRRALLALGVRRRPVVDRGV